MKYDPDRFVDLGHGTPGVCRLGLASRGGRHLKAKDVGYAIERGIGYLNWCGHADGMSRAIRELGPKREDVVVATQISARSRKEAEEELEDVLSELGSDYLDIATFYYVEHESEWDEITAVDGALAAMEKLRGQGKVKMLGLTSHQRKLAASIAETRALDMLMIRYNAAHRGAEKDIFPTAHPLKIPVVTFTSLRWGALMEPTQEDPPGFSPPSAADCYRFVLSNPSVAVALMAPADRDELDANLVLLDNWGPMGPEEETTMRAHGDRVYRNAGSFP